MGYHSGRHSGRHSKHYLGRRSGRHFERNSERHLKHYWVAIRIAICKANPVVIQDASLDAIWETIDVSKTFS